MSKRPTVITIVEAREAANRWIGWLMTSCLITSIVALRISVWPLFVVTVLIGICTFLVIGALNTMEATERRRREQWQHWQDRYHPRERD